MTTCRIILLLLVSYTTGSFAAFIGQNNRRTAVDLVTTNLNFHSYFHHRYGFASMISSSDDVSIVRSNEYKYRYTSKCMALNTSNNVNETEEKTKSKIVNLYFSADERYSSNYAMSSEKSLYDFFNIEEHRDLLLSAGKESKGKGLFKNSEFTPKLQTKFQSEARKHGIEDAFEADSISVVYVVTETKFPGLTVASKSTMAVRLLKENENKLPEYQFVLLDASQDARGAPPVVWLFKKLTGSNKNKDGDLSSTEKSSPSSFTRVFAKIDKNGYVAFEADGFLRVTLSFPPIMIKLLPLSIEKFEEQGSASIQKVLDKSLRASIDSFLKAYIDWTGV